MSLLPFQYSIKFPDTESPNSEEDETSAFEIIHKNEAEDPKPVVILLGWAGCKEKHLSKYAQMYEQKGYITVKVLVQQHLLYFRPNKVGEVAKELIVILTNNNIASNPMIFHVFSNGGCMVYAHLTTLISSAKSEYYQKLSVRGIIFDSTPGKRRILQAVRAFMNMLPYSVIIRYLLGMCLLVYLVVTRVVMLLLPVSIGTAKGFTLYDTISEDPAQCPQLFLYSKADSVILAEDVDEMIAARKAKGITVKSVCWEDSHHVAHFRAHPEVYTKTCMDFVSACLASDEAKL